MGTSFISGNYLRLALVTDVDYSRGIARTEWIDQTASTGPDIPIPHPFAGKGGEGIFVGLRKGAIVVLGAAAEERWLPVFTLPLRGYYQDLVSTDEMDFEDVGFPVLDGGEVAIQGKTGALVHLYNDGDIRFTNAFQEGFVLGGDSENEHRCGIFVSTPVQYNVSESGLKADGTIRRDVRIETGEFEFEDYLKSVSSEQALEQIGWNPNTNVSLISRPTTGQTITTKGDQANVRNPAFVENREIVFEFGRQWSVETFEDEKRKSSTDEFTIINPKNRRERRSNVLSLSLDHPNELIEKVQGTLVDVFGNIVDINRNIIPIPTQEKELLNQVFENSRHTIALHMEINARKGWAYREGATDGRPTPPLPNGPEVNSAANNSRDRSRWFMDIDKEGLTKINIPASSETGNIPRLARYENSSTIQVDAEGNVKNNKRENTSKLYRNTKNLDILLDQFGPGGIKIEGDQTPNRLKNKKTSWVDEDGQKVLPEFVESGTAFHDITATAKTLLKKNINKKASDVFSNSSVPEDALALSNSLNPISPNDKLNNLPNAGGRSVHLNLDGSLESSIGANTVDRVSWVLDTAGAIVARLGRDKSGRSAVVHADGSIAIEIGGFDFIGESSTDEVDTRFVGNGIERKDSLPNDPKRFKSGQMVLRIRRANKSGDGPDVDDSLIIIDDTGMTIQTAGRLNFVSDMDITLASKSRILLDAPQVQAYASMSKLFRRDLRAT